MSRPPGSTRSRCPSSGTRCSRLPRRWAARSAAPPISEAVREGDDFSTGIFDRRGQLIAQGNYSPGHLGAMPYVVKNVLEYFPTSAFRPGDSVLVNDSFLGSGHMPDCFMVSPAFLGDQLVAFAVNVAHHVDVGGAAPGSQMIGGISEAYQEGIRILPVRIVREGRFDEDLLRLILGNVRLPDKVEGDLKAQRNANFVGARRLVHLYESMGEETVEAGIQAIIARSEEEMRAAAADPGRLVELRGPPRRLWPRHPAGEGRRRRDHEIRFRDRGLLAKQRPGQGRDQLVHQLHARVRQFRRARVRRRKRSPERRHDPLRLGRGAGGQLLQPQHPRPAAAGPRCRSASSRPSRGDREGAAGSCDGGLFPLVQPQHRRRRRAHRQAVRDVRRRPRRLRRADGYRRGRGTLPGVQLRQHPLEVHEINNPVRIRQFGFVPDIAGNGRYRGGCGVGKEIELRAESATARCSATAMSSSPTASSAAGPARRVHDAAFGRGRATLGSKEALTLHRGDVLRIRLSGAGGYGDPAARGLEAIADDVADGFSRRTWLRARAPHGSTDPSVQTKG